MTEEKQVKRILYLDDYSVNEPEYRQIVDGVEIFASYDDETARRLYDKHNPFDLVRAHLSCPNVFEFFNFIRGRDKRVLIYCMSALNGRREDIKKALDDLFPSYDGILMKQNFRESLEMTLNRMIRILDGK